MLTATDCQYGAVIKINEFDCVVCLSSEDIRSQQHASIVTFDFSQKQINIYPKSDGKTIPSSPVVSLPITVVNNEYDKYIIEVGKVERNLYARITNYYTLESDVLKVDETSDFKYKAGWLHDILCFSQISGTSVLWEKIYGRIGGNIDDAYLGDSIVEGYGVSYDECWVKLVIYEASVGVNMGRSGATIDICQDIVDKTLSRLKNKPKRVITTIGTNGGNTTVKLEKLKSSIEALGAEAIINHIYRMSSDTTSINNDIASLHTRSARFDIATSKGYILSNQKNGDCYQSDGVHLSKKGNIECKNRFMIDVERKEAVSK